MDGLCGEGFAVDEFLRDDDRRQAIGKNGRS
jgi:hypothetical protein